MGVIGYELIFGKRPYFHVQRKALQQEILTKNAKSKIISELENEYIMKCEQHKNLLKAIKKMEELIKEAYIEESPIPISIEN